MVFNENLGVIYAAVGNIKYVEQALISKRSIQRFNSETKFAILTDICVEEADWDFVIPYHSDMKLKPSNYMLPKLQALINSPFEHTIFLDSDTFILDDITPTFELLKKFDLIYTSSHMCIEKDLIARGNIKSKDGETYKILDQSVPVTFFAVQGGFFCYKKIETVDFLNWVLNEYLRRGFYDDQTIFREALWKFDFKTYILPRSYNFNSLYDWFGWFKDKFIDLKPTIWHYTKHKYLNEQELYQMEQVFNCSKSVFSLVFNYLKFRLIRKIS